MFLVVGLGNPGREYDGTRHNVGFMAVDELRRAEAWPDFKAKFSGLWTRGELGAESVVLLKPQTYMNLSGDSVQAAATFLKVPANDIVVVHDELDLPWREVRLKVGGGHAGHNGIRSLIQHLGPDFVRLRIGIGKPPPGFRGDGADWVLSRFDAVEAAELAGVLDTALAAVRTVVRDGVSEAMKRVNTRPRT
ncbi:MAG TPA: aminoacyl-tRNA hydrolase [Polyangiaceae bacterium]|nr:aminoacyl-tRNA hydrolase [Polyangiaceae bacterium]